MYANVEHSKAVELYLQGQNFPDARIARRMNARLRQIGLARLESVLGHYPWTFKPCEGTGLRWQLR